VICAKGGSKAAAGWCCEQAMPAVKVRVSSGITPRGVQIDAAANSIRQVLTSIIASYPELRERLYDVTGEPRRALVILVNGKHIRYLADLETELRNGDEVYIMPMSSGGSPMP
jgi:MoaD family protein